MKREKRSMTARRVEMVVFILLVFAFSLGLMMGSAGYLAELMIKSGLEQQKEVKSVEELTGSRAFEGNNTASVTIPAVMANDTGVYATLVVRAVPGTGKIFVQMNNLLVNDDTQQSIRKAALVASKLADVNLSTVDLYYEINAPATELEGGSGGATIAVATYAALTGKKLRDDVMMTGSINHDGTVSIASKVIEKAKVAESLGMKYFLVPKGMKMLYDYKPTTFCYEWQDGVEFCDTEYERVKTELWNLSVEVVEVSTLREALKYFLE